MLQSYFKIHQKEKAQGIVEFALIIPVLLLIILGIIEFGRLLFFYSSVTSASREAARFGSAVGEFGGVDRYRDCAGIRNAARSAGVFAAIADGDISIQYDDGTTLKDASCPPTANIGLADRIVVTITKGFTPIVPIVNLPAIPITSTTARTIIREVGVKGTPVPTDPPPAADTATPTVGPGPTPSNTATFTPTATATETPTPTGTATAGPTSTLAPTNTPSNTPTATNTPIPICGLEFRNFQQPSDKKITWDLYNNPNPGVLPVTIESFQLNFSTSKLSQIDFDGVTIWNGPPASPIVTINTWLGNGADRYLGVVRGRLIRR